MYKEKQDSPLAEKSAGQPQREEFSTSFPSAQKYGFLTEHCPSKVPSPQVAIIMLFTKKENPAKSRRNIMTKETEDFKSFMSSFFIIKNSKRIIKSYLNLYSAIFVCSFYSRYNAGFPCFVFPALF